MIKPMNEYNPVYIDGILHWKKIGEKTGKLNRKKKQYPMISLDKIILDEQYPIDQEVLEASREQYNQTHELIPVYLSYDMKLLYGYEQYLVAVEQGSNQIPFQRATKPKKNFNESVHNSKIGNKKFYVKDINNQKIFISYNRNKKVKNLMDLCKEKGLQVQISPQFLFTVTDKSEKKIVSGQTLSESLSIVKGVVK